MILTGTNIQIEKKTAYRLIDCYDNSPIYGEIEELYEEIEGEMIPLVQARGILSFAEATELFLDKDSSENEHWEEGSLQRNDFENKEYALLLYTLGDEISSYVSTLFSEGDYLKGMLADAMADSCLFSMEKEWTGILTDECRKRNLGIAQRMEAPTDFSMEVQKRVWQLLDGASIGVMMTSGAMFSPVKTICLMFLLTDDVCQNNTGHDCSRCTNINCKLRNEK